MAAPNTGDREELNFEATEVNYEWQINNFTTNLPYMQDIVKSQPFPGEDLPQWCLHLYPKGKVTQTQKFAVYLNLKKAEKEEKSIVVDFNLQFLDHYGTELAGKRFAGKKFDESHRWGFTIESNSDDPIPLSTLGNLIVRVTIFIRKPVQKVSVRSAIEIPKASALGDLSELLKSGEYADFFIESVDGKVFPTHKAILSTRNPLFFGLMFTSATKEARENRVKLPFEGEIVSSLLEYLYTDEVVNLTPIAARLYAVAHQYQLGRLMVICAANISQNLTVAKIFIALRIAKKFEDAKLLAACQKFIDEHQMVFDATFAGDSYPKSDDSWLGRIIKWFKGAR